MKRFTHFIENFCETLFEQNSKHLHNKHFSFTFQFVSLYSQEQNAYFCPYYRCVFQSTHFRYSYLKMFNERSHKKVLTITMFLLFVMEYQNRFGCNHSTKKKTRIYFTSITDSQSTLSSFQ